ncbi:MAG TPA: polyphenol oxidase family protein [Candidatus Nitrosocosmicus sp.]|nr:polyphenol oxidase family protein [Candidatus Nitrosocosmicus sp.]
MNISDFQNVVLNYSTSDDGNMSFLKGDYKSTLDNRKRFLKKNNLAFSDIVVSATSGNYDTYIASKKDLGKGARDGLKSIQADAVMTNTNDVYLFLLTGDCLPISVYDPVHTVISLVHLSKSNSDFILKKTIKHMSEKFKCSPENLIVEIGPSIGPCHYDTDLWQLVESDLLDLGVNSNNISNLKICTYESGKYYSHRKASDDNLIDARFCTILGLK